MAKQRYLKNAPIIEALIDFQVRLPDSFNAEKFSSLKEELRDKYPKVETGRRSTVIIKDGKPVVKRTPDKNITAYRFISKDKKEIAQFRIDGFKFSRLHPYTKWELVSSEAKRLWEYYKHIASPKLIEKIAVNYISRLDIPIPIEDFGEYLNAPPILPEKLPQGLGQYFMRMTVAEKGLFATIVQTIDKSPKPEHIGIILDIEAFYIKHKGIGEEKLWPTFEKLRELKNRIFFELITEKAARLFE